MNKEKRVGSYRFRTSGFEQEIDQFIKSLPYGYIIIRKKKKHSCKKAARKVEAKLIKYKMPYKICLYKKENGKDKGILFLISRINEMPHWKKWFSKETIGEDKSGSVFSGQNKFRITGVRIRAERNFDISRLFRSKEIADYLEEFYMFSPLCEQYVIMWSWCSMEEKIELLRRQLEFYKDHKDYLTLLKRTEVYEKAYRFIKKPPKGTIYIARMYADYPYEEYEEDWEDIEDTRQYQKYELKKIECFGSYDELMADWNGFARLYGDHYMVDVQMLLNPGRKWTSKRKGKLGQPLNFVMESEDDHMSIKYIYFVPEYFGGNLGDFYENMEEMYASVPLPFEHGCRVRMKTPSMAKPTYGVISSKLVGKGRWICSMVLESEEYDAKRLRKEVIDRKRWRGFYDVDVSGPKFDYRDSFLVYDWLERVEDDE
jgi:hypothetical protein